MAQPGSAWRSRNAGSSKPIEGFDMNAMAEAGFARRSQNAGSSKPFEGFDIKRYVFDHRRMQTYHP